MNVSRSCQNESYMLKFGNLLTGNSLLDGPLNSTGLWSFLYLFWCSSEIENYSFALWIIFSLKQPRFITILELLGSSPNNNDVHHEKPSERKIFDPLVSESNFLFELSLLQLGLVDFLSSTSITYMLSANSPSSQSWLVFSPRSVKNQRSQIRMRAKDEESWEWIFSGQRFSVEFLVVDILL